MEHYGQRGGKTAMDLMGTKAIYIADGHHRYTTALEYQRRAREANGGSLPPNHPANYCMFVLIAMQDDGLLIHPTHRLIGGLTDFNIETPSSRRWRDNLRLVEIYSVARRICR